MSNSTLFGNSAGQNYVGGGGIYNNIGGTVTVISSTLNGNFAPTGGGILNYSGTLTLQDTIVAGNTATFDPDIYGSITTDNGYNLLGTLVTPEPNDVSSDSPLLGALGNYGGPTETMPLLPGSPAIGAGSNPLDLATDQRGEPRSVNGTVDIGAFESQGFTLSIVSGNGQSAVITTAFDPVVVNVTANNPVEPVDDGEITFTVTPAADGAAANLSSTMAPIAGGLAGVNATANPVAGSYAVSASAGGAASPVSFSLTNIPATPIVAVNPVNVPFGTPLANTQLSGTATYGGQTVAGSFSYTSAAGTILNGGAYTLSATFTPADTTDYTTQTASVSLTVNPDATTTAPTTVTAAYSTSAQTLTLTGNVTSSNSSVPVSGGTFTFTVAGFGAVTSDIVSNGTATASFTLPARTAPQAFTITTAYSGSTDFFTSTNSTGALTETKATPVITWLNPANITYGTALSGTQLDATYSVGGTHTYTPAAGTVLNAGIQTLTVAFTPTNTTDYISTSKSVTINVLTATLTVTTASKSKTYGAAFTAFTGGLTGVKNGDAITIGSYSSAGSAATATVAGGPYVISAALSDPGSKLSNYTVVTSYGSLTVSPAPLTITADNATKIYGDTFSIGNTWNGAVGLKNSDTLTSVTETSAGTAATAAAGNYSVVASAAIGMGLSNYAITYANGHLTVTKAALTITANNQNKTYGQASNLGTTAFTASGLENSDTVTSVTLTSAGAAATATVAGSPYNIVPRAAVSTELTNYSVTYVDGLLTVTTAALTITANNQSKTYGLALNLGTTAFTASGLANSDTVTSVTLTSTGAAATATVAGSPYNIVASAAVGARLANYTITYVAGLLTVNPAPLTITAKNASKTYGQTITFVGTAFTDSGLKNGDTVTSVTLTSTGAVAGSPYSIVPSAAVGTGLSNYAITYAVSGQLTVNRAPLTITANNQAKTYGQTLTLPGTAFTSSVLANSDTVTSVTETSTGSAATAAAGTYNIVPTAVVGTGLSNYAITYVDGQLTVSKASPAFSSLSSPGIAHGPTFVGVPATISGEVAAGTTFATGSVVITITGNGVDFTKAATIGATNGVFSAVFTETWAVGTYTVSYHYAGNSNFNAITPDGTSSLVVS